MLEPMKSNFYRLLKEGETMLQGDELQNVNTGKWEPIPEPWGNKCKVVYDNTTTFGRFKMKVRRKIEVA